MLPRIVQAVLPRSRTINFAACNLLKEHGCSIGMPARWLSSSEPTDGQPTASTSGRPAQPNKLLMRDFIQNSLYHPTLGYFNQGAPVVGHIGDPINYWKIYCADEWREVVSKKYKELQTSFLTPVELFSPWYGGILARHMLEHRKHNLGLAPGSPLIITEIGGGNGTLARDMLDWLRDNAPADYARTTYTCLEISSRLASRQYETVIAQGGHVGRFQVQRGNAWDASAWGAEPDMRHTHIVMMEVLDNLPHDRVFRSSPRGPWQQTAVVPQGSKTMEYGPWQEVLEDVSDPLVQRALGAVYKEPTFDEKMDKQFNRLLDFLLARDTDPEVAGGGEVVWLPTACLSLLDVLHKMRPNHSLMAADFDVLPDVKVPGRLAPLVSQKVGGRNIDHDTVFVPWGTSDIFFPTDFAALGRLYQQSAEHVWGEGGGGQLAAAHYRQGAVVKRYKEMVRTATICSFNPMVDDFINARFFFGDATGRRVGGPAIVLPSLQKAADSRRRQAFAPPPSTGIPEGLPEWAQRKLKQQQERSRPTAQQQQQQAAADEPVLGAKKLQRKD